MNKQDIFDIIFCPLVRIRMIPDRASGTRSGFCRETPARIDLRRSKLFAISLRANIRIPQSHGEQRAEFGRAAFAASRSQAFYLADELTLAGFRFGSYKITPESPELGTLANPAKVSLQLGGFASLGACPPGRRFCSCLVDSAVQVWSNWDPNWRHFIGITLILILEEYRPLLSTDIQSLVEESIYISTIGDEYRRAEPTPDGLYPSYSNPAYMRAIQAAWIGDKRQDHKLIEDSERWTAQVQ